MRERADHELDDEAAAGLQRLQSALAGVDQRSANIIACHFAIEREMDQLLGVLFPNPKPLGNLGFGKKINVISASLTLETIGDLAQTLVLFNALRNVVAHNDGAKAIDTLFAKVTAAAQKLAGEDLRVVEVVDVMLAITGVLGAVRVAFIDNGEEIVRPHLRRIRGLTTPGRVS